MDKVVLWTAYLWLGSYWTSSGPYDEIYYYVENDVAQVRDDIALMVTGTPVLAKVQEYAATSMKLTTRDEIFSAMVVYGFLSYKNGYVSIPNKELMDKFADMIQKEPSLGYSEKPEYTGRILAVGIAYYKEDKKHSCKIEVLREKE